MDITDDIHESDIIGDIEYKELDHFNPIEVIDADNVNEDSKLDSMVDEAMKKLSTKFNLDKPITNPAELMNLITETTADNKKIFDLLSSKVSSEVHSRVRFKATLAADTLLDKMADMISNVDSFDYRTDPMSFLLLIEKYMDFIERSDRISQKYENPNINESIENISLDSKGPKDNVLSPSEYADLVNKTLNLIRSENKDK